MYLTKIFAIILPTFILFLAKVVYYSYARISHLEMKELFIIYLFTDNREMISES